MSAEKKKGWLFKQPVNIEVDGEHIQIHGFMPLPAVMCTAEAYDMVEEIDEKTKKKTKKSVFNPKKLSAEMIRFFIKHCVIDPPVDDEFLQNSDGVFLMKLVGQIYATIQPDEAQLKEIKKTMPTKP